MRIECIDTHKLLSRYLAGRVFSLQRSRVESHLAECPICSSELDALRRIRETERFLEDLGPGRGIAGTIRSFGSAVMVLFYRPLWVIVILVSTLALYRNVLTPMLHDPELEMLDAGAPLPPAAAPQALATAPDVLPAAPVQSEPKNESLPAADPLVVVITVDKGREKESMKHINDAMKEHALLGAMLFTDKVREVAGNLTADELYVFFNRIREVAKIGYKRSRLTSSGSGSPLPVVLKLQTQAASDRDAAAPPSAQ